MIMSGIKRSDVNEEQTLNKYTFVSEPGVPNESIL
jgi:hypothetical protein